MKPTLRIGILQALGVAAYISVVAIFMSQGKAIFGNLNGFTGPITILMLLSISVLACGMIVFFKPYKLFIADKKKEAMESVLYTAGGLFAIFILFLIGLLIFG